MGNSSVRDSSTENKAIAEYFSLRLQLLQHWLIISVIISIEWVRHSERGEKGVLCSQRLKNSLRGLASGYSSIEVVSFTGEHKMRDLSSPLCFKYEKYHLFLISSEVKVGNLHWVQALSCKLPPQCAFSVHHTHFLVHSHLI